MASNDHVVIAGEDCRHYVGHGITGTLGMPVTVALRPEKIRISRRPPEPEEGMAPAPFNQVKGRVKDMVYFGSDTLYHLQLPSGAILKATQSNTERHPDESLTWDDEAYAWWLPTAHVVLTR